MLSAGARVPVPVVVVVVLDSCTDGSRRLAGSFGPDVHFIEIDAGSVGTARAAGFSYARSALAEQADQAAAWFATTDADSVVDPDWLVRQTASGADMVLGVVRVANWRHFPAAAIRRYLAAYRAKRRPDGHGHVHGANMGFGAETYWQVGGFAELSTAEDVDLVQRFEEGGYRIDRDARLSVVTSARQLGRAPRGFAAHLRSVQRDRA